MFFAACILQCHITLGLFFPPRSLFFPIIGLGFGPLIIGINGGCFAVLFAAPIFGINGCLCGANGCCAVLAAGNVTMSITAVPLSFPIIIGLVVMLLVYRHRNVLELRAALGHVLKPWDTCFWLWCGTCLLLRCGVFVFVFGFCHLAGIFLDLRRALGWHRYGTIS